MENRDQLLLTEFDLATISYEMQMLKAFIPYVEVSQQKTLALFIRMFELISTLDFYNHMKDPCPLNRTNRDKKEMFNEIKKFCPKKNLEMFEMMSNMDNISEYLKMYQAMSTPAEDQKQTDILKNFLSPEQQQLYESYKDMLNI